MITREGFVDAPDLAEVGGIWQHMKIDASGELLVVRSWADVEPILEENKRLLREAEEGNGGYSPSREWRRVATIPNIIVHKWLAEEGISIYRKEDWPRIAAKLDSPEYQYLRTAPGRVARRPLREYVAPRRLREYVSANLLPPVSQQRAQIADAVQRLR